MIKIASFNGYTQFSSGSMLHIATSYLKCDICKTRCLSSVYLRIIKMLEKADLLPDDFVKTCCICFFVKKEIGFNYCKKCDEIIIISDLPRKKSFTETKRHYIRNNSFIKHLECRKCGKVYKRILYTDNKRVSGSTCPI